ncbi:hypothetical protein JYB87_12240 [Shewanella avicenniae]|uniref:Uncharacterized protein n=1 Tax=Shewanella avicenniae TaxID=2814294 RepID=A0ABX7QVV2_9GAMM|nr:hypothetical protein [Shewanella avicenniae]QSX35574.1 hypothetical protein JYB87_12240 [Shewanella avicenniae]
MVCADQICGYGISSTDLGNKAYLYWKKDEEQAKSTATDAKALLLYFRFLHQNNLNYWQLLQD